MFPPVSTEPLSAKLSKREAIDKMRPACLVDDFFPDYADRQCSKCGTASEAWWRNMHDTEEIDLGGDEGRACALELKKKIGNAPDI